MYPILMRTESGFIYTFTAVWGGGIALAIAFMWWQTGPHKRPLPVWADPLLLGGLAAIFLGRLQFVIQNQAYFAENPTERWAIASGGIGYGGVMLGLGLVVGMFIWRKPEIGRILLPTVGLLIAWFHLVGWLACLFEGCAFGAETTLAWYAADLPDTFGVLAVRYRTQMAGIFFSAAILAVAAVQYRLSGPVSGLWLGLLIFLVQIMLTTLRGDEMPLIFDRQMRIDTLIGVFIAVVYCLWWLKLLPKNLYV
ncbi:MAG: prolipoprotein diacylglyceryl transferase family protein [Chloroflexota bacterium]